LGFNEYSEPGLFSGAPPVFLIFFFAIAAIIIGGILFTVVKGVGTWSQNNASPVLTRQALIVAKRTQVWGGSGESSASTNYYATFQFEDNSREEFQIKDSQFGLMAEGDHGVLDSQGTRFLDFQRT
jgi:lipopolysaccharide export LptBFGC system permease protein LptF